MALRKGHGAGKGVPRIEVLPPDELPDPVPAEPAQLARREDGTIADSESAKALGARGGAAKAQKKRLLQGMGLVQLTEDKVFTPYYKAAQAWLDHQVETYARMSGGFLGAGPSTFLGNAAIALALSRYCADKGFNQDDENVSRQTLRYMDAFKQQQLAAYELAVREAKMREALSENAGLDVFEAALQSQKSGDDER
jgi:hypothetical protein